MNTFSEATHSSAYLFSDTFAHIHAGLLNDRPERCFQIFFFHNLSPRSSYVTLALSLWTKPLGHMLPPVNKYANTDKHTQ